VEAIWERKCNEYDIFSAFIDIALIVERNMEVKEKNIFKRY